MLRLRRARTRFVAVTASNQRRKRRGSMGQDNVTRHRPRPCKRALIDALHQDLAQRSASDVIRQTTTSCALRRSTGYLRIHNQSESSVLKRYYQVGLTRQVASRGAWFLLVSPSSSGRRTRRSLVADRRSASSPSPKVGRGGPAGVVQSALNCKSKCRPGMPTRRRPALPSCLRQ